MGRHSEILSFSQHFLFVTNKYFTTFTSCGLNRQIWTRYFVWHQNQRASTSESRDILRGKFHQRQNLPPEAAGPHPRLAHARRQLKVTHAWCVVYPIECDHIYVNRFISHEVTVSECITLQTLHRRFRPGTSCVGLILKTYSRQNNELPGSRKLCRLVDWWLVLWCISTSGFK